MRFETRGCKIHTEAKLLEHDKINDLKDGLKQRFDEILDTINSRDSLLEEFDEEIFNALVEKIEVLTPAHFVFELSPLSQISY